MVLDTAGQRAAEAGFAKVNAGRERDEALTQRLTEEYSKTVEGMRAVFKTGRSKDVEWRRRQLQGLRRAFHEMHEEIATAVIADLGGPKMRALGDMGPIVGDAEYALEHLDEWTKPKTIPGTEGAALNFGNTSVVRPTPKGIILNVAPWNFPLAMCFQPLVAALAAGNGAMIKPSEMAPNCAAVIKKIVETYLDTELVKVTLGAVPETTALLAQKWDHIFYTGNGCIGRIVMEAAAKHLTPMTLELGGKSPCIIDSTAKIDAAVNRIFFAKTMNCGQVCIAPDYVLVHESKQEEFTKKFVGQVKKSFGEDHKASPHWGRIINGRHAQRLTGLIESAGGQVLSGGADKVDVQEKFVPLTVIKDVPLSAPIMHEEIFGPILPIIPVKTMEEALSIVEEKERPLALYVFSEDKKFVEETLTRITSGGAAVNSAMEQIIANKELPFGGTGGSGFGKYHGRAGFEEFSHMRSVLYKTTMHSNSLMPPPEAQPAWMYDAGLKMMVVGFVSDSTRQKLKVAKWIVGGIALAALIKVALATSVGHGILKLASGK